MKRGKRRGKGRSTSKLEEGKKEDRAVEQQLGREAAERLRAPVNYSPEPISSSDSKPFPYCGLAHSACSLAVTGGGAYS